MTASSFKCYNRKFVITRLGVAKFFYMLDQKGLL